MDQSNCDVSILKSYKSFAFEKLQEFRCWSLWETPHNNPNAPEQYQAIGEFKGYLCPVI
jgi:hypothetical protein